MIALFTRMADGLRIRLSAERWFLGASLVRIAFGGIVLSLYLMHIPDRQFLFGPSGMLSWPTFRSMISHSGELNVYGFSSTGLYFNIIFFLGLLISVAFTVGYKTRIMTPLFVLFTWSIYHREPYMMDGGYRLMNIILIYLIFADLGQYFSLDAYLRARSGKPAVTNSVSRMFHNAAILTCAMQVCVVYFFSTFYKITGSSWQEGTGVYYALTLEQFHIGPLADLVGNSPFISTVLTYLTLLYQSAFPWLIWNRHTKYVMIALATGFHGSIAVAMGLYEFSAIMIACEFFFVNDAEYKRIFAFTKRLLTRTSTQSAVSAMRVEARHELLNPWRCGR